MTTPPFPNFLVIGAQKSATRWLRINLGQHPDIFTASRELEFFNRRYENGFGWYRTRFEGWSGERFIGEATPGYMMWNEHPRRIAARIDGALAGVKLIALLRNPIDRTYSAFIHHMRRGRLDPQADLLEYVKSIEPERDRLSLISGSWYGASLEPFVERFGKRLLTVLYDDVGDQPVGVYRTALEHIGAESTFLPDELDVVRFGGDVPAESSYEDGERRRPLDDAERLQLFAFFEKDLARLENLVGLDLRRWRPKGAE